MKRVLLKKEKQGFSKPSRTGFIHPSKMGFTQPSLMTGFTMVETLVAISILLLVIIGPMTIAQKGIQNAYFARDQLTAVFLAQEAIEAVRELRDDQALIIYDKLIQEEATAQTTWGWLASNKIDGVCKTATGCGFNPTTRVFQSCDEIEACKLRVDENGLYSYENGLGTNPSIFSRKVYIENISGVSVKIRVVVTWYATATGGPDRTVELETWLYDRYRHYQT